MSQSDGATAGGGNDATQSVEPLVAHVLTQLVRTKVGLRLGMTLTEAREALAGSAHSVGTHVLSLDATPYAFGGARGTVRIGHPLKGEPQQIDEIQVALLCGAFDAKNVGAMVIAVGRALGYDVELDGSEEGLYWGFDAADRSLWVSLAGKGVILIEFNLDERPVTSPTARQCRAARRAR